MRTTSAYYKSSGKELVSRQLLKFFERNSAKNVPNSLITLVGMTSDFEVLFVLKFLIIQVTWSARKLWKLKILLDFFICFLIATMLGSPQVCDCIINVIII